MPNAVSGPPNGEEEMSTDQRAPTREVARYVVELSWKAPRKWGARNLPRAGRFHAWALLASPQRRLWTFAEATGEIGHGGLETTELAILASGDGDAEAPLLEPGECFDLSPTGIGGRLVAARGRVVSMAERR